MIGTLIRVGTTGSCDLLVEFSGERLRTTIINLAAGIDDALVGEFITTALRRHGLDDLAPAVYYNGANSWVVDARLESCWDLLGNTHPTRGGTGP